MAVRGRSSITAAIRIEQDQAIFVGRRYLLAFHALAGQWD
jgi:hypothetical protein